MFLICDISNKNCQQLYLRNVTVFWVDNLFKTHSGSRPVSSGTQRQTGGAWRVRAVASNRETMRGIWICQSQVPAFFSKHKLFIYEFIDFSLSSCIFFIHLLISVFKKSGKVIGPAVCCHFWEFLVAGVTFCSVCLSFYPEKSPQNGVEIHLKSSLFIIDHTTLSILDPLRYLSLYSNHDFEMRAYFLLIAAFHVVE